MGINRGAEVMASVTVNREMGTVTIDRAAVLVIPDDAQDIHSFMEWFQQQPEVTPRHTSLAVRSLQQSITLTHEFWQPIDFTPSVHSDFCSNPDGELVDSEYCLKSIKAFAADGDIEQVAAWGLFAANQLKNAEIDTAYWRSKHGGSYGCLD